MKFCTAEYLIIAESLLLYIGELPNIPYEQIKSYLCEKKLRFDSNKCYTIDNIKKNVKFLFNNIEINNKNINELIKTLREKRKKELQNVINEYDKRITELQKTNMLAPQAISSNVFENLPLVLPLLSNYDVDNKTNVGELYTLSSLTTFNDTTFRDLMLTQQDTTPTIAASMPSSQRKSNNNNMLLNASTVSSITPQTTINQPPLKKQKTEIINENDINENKQTTATTTITTTNITTTANTITTKTDDNNNNNNNSDNNNSDKLETITKEVLLNIVEEVSSDERSQPFLRPVKLVDAPNYYKIIKNPMDLNTIKTKINSKEINNIVELSKKFNLIFFNAMSYNAKNSAMYKLAVSFNKWIIERLKARFPNHAKSFKVATPPIKRASTSNKRSTNDIASSPVTTKRKASAAPKRKRSTKRARKPKLFG